MAIIHRNKRDSHTNQDQPLSVPSACCCLQSRNVGAAFLGLALNSGASNLEIFRDLWLLVMMALSVCSHLCTSSDGPHWLLMLGAETIASVATFVCNKYQNRKFTEEFGEKILSLWECWITTIASIIASTVRSHFKTQELVKTWSSLMFILLWIYSRPGMGFLSGSDAYDALSLSSFLFCSFI